MSDQSEALLVAMGMELGAVRQRLDRVDALLDEVRAGLLGVVKRKPYQAPTLTGPKPAPLPMGYLDFLCPRCATHVITPLEDRTHWLRCDCGDYMCAPNTAGLEWAKAMRAALARPKDE